MATIIAWRDKTLQVGANVVNAVSDFTMRRSLKLKEHTADGKVLKNKENEDAATLSFTVQLLDSLGVNVKAEVLSWMAHCADGGRGLLYLGGVDYLGEEVLLSSSEVSRAELTPGGRMRMAELNLTFTASKMPPAPPAPAKKKKKKKKKKTDVPQSGGGALPNTGAAFRAMAAARAASRNSLYH